MYIDYKLEGKYVYLRSVTEDDAEFILKVRNDPRVSKYLPPLNVTVDQQRQWISKQRADSNSYYFILETPDLVPIGTLSIYDIVGDHGEGGRSCSIGEPAANIEASVLLNNFTFETLGLSYATIWVYEENKAVIALNEAFGYEWTSEGEDANGQPYKVGILRKENYLAKREKLLTKLRIIK